MIVLYKILPIIAVSVRVKMLWNEIYAIIDLDIKGHTKDWGYI